MPKAKSASVSDIAAGINRRCSDNELPKGLPVAPVPVTEMLPTVFTPAWDIGKFCV